MHEPHHTDVIEDNIETHPVKLALGVGIGAIALVVAILMLAEFAVMSWGTRSLERDPSMSPEAVSKRLEPVAKLAIDPNATPPAFAATAPAAGAQAPVPAVAIPPPAAKAADTAGDRGKTVYEGSCAACHAAGVAGAPKLGDKAAWSARLKAGKDALYAAALKGKGAMPPKGGNLTLSDADVKAAVDYLVAAAR